MKNSDDLEREVLDGARRALEPTADDRLRIQQALAKRLAAAAAGLDAPERPLDGKDGDPGAPTSPPSSGPGTPFEQLGPSAAGAGLGWLPIVGAAILAGSVGFATGYRTGQHRSASSADARPSALSTAAPSPAPSVVVVPPRRDAEPEAPPEFESADATAAAPTAPRSSPSLSGERPAGRNEEAQDSAYEELAQLRRAERAVRRGEPLLALALLEELDARLPQGQFIEERAAARVMASCQREPGSAARDRAQEFLTTYPRSVYAARIRALCENANGE